MDPRDFQFISSYRALLLEKTAKQAAGFQELGFKNQQFEEALKLLITSEQFWREKCSEKEHILEELGAQNKKLLAELKTVQHKYSSARLRLCKYEKDERLRESQDVALRDKQFMLEQQLKQASRKLLTVKEMVGSGSQSSTPVHFAPVLVSSRSECTQTTFASSSCRDVVCLPTDASNAAVPNRHLSNVTERASRCVERFTYFNPKFHRRSKSASGLAIDHQPEIAVPTGTILKPFIAGRKKLVTELKKHNLAKATDYFLTHQDVDSSGNLRTRIIKGAVIPTAGGSTADGKGVSVVFTDVEELCHKSPAKLTDQQERADMEALLEELNLSDQIK